MSTPLTSPHPAPTASAQKIMTAGPYDWVATVVAHTDASAITLPTDRSIPPPMITIVTPTVITPMIDAEVRIVRRLPAVANVSVVATPMTASTTSTTTRPRLRPTPVSSSRASGEPGAALAPARSTRPCSAAGGVITAGRSSSLTCGSLRGSGPP
jgi:hypothetical protein